MLELQRYGLTWDEGRSILVLRRCHTTVGYLHSLGPDPYHRDHFKGSYGPYRQSLRTEIYRKYANEIVQSSKAYRCFCSADRLDKLARRRNELGLPLGYDRKCVELSAHEAEDRAARVPYVIRLKAAYDGIGSNPKAVTPVQEQEVFNDPILLKSDGHPTYHFANVVDDHLMQITHVIRGNEWASVTPLHVALYEAFGWEPPFFCHVPLVVDQSGQKLSKRDKNCDLATYQGPSGVDPEVLLNFVALLGWSHGEKSDVFTLEELERVFRPNFTKGNAMLNLEKLYFLQKMHTKRIIDKASTQSTKFQALVDDIRREVDNQISSIEISEPALRHMIERLVRADAHAFSGLSFSPQAAPVAEFVMRNAYFFTALNNRPPHTLGVDIALPNVHTVALALCLTPASAWNVGNLVGAVEALTLPTGRPEPSDPSLRVSPDEHVRKFRKGLFHWLRWALLAGSPGPPIFTTMELLGRERSHQRIQDAIRLSRASEQGGELRWTKPSIEVQMAARSDR